MPRPFPELRERLLRAGVAPRYVRRYMAELSDHLADLTTAEQQAGLSPAAAKSAALIRLGNINTLSQAMIQQRRFQSWTARAPWAIFGITPLTVLAVAWFVSLFLLWYGWQLFLPGTISPFGTTPSPHHIFEPRNIYFQLDRALFFAAPILIGWLISLTAVRQRVAPNWPVSGLAIVAYLTSTAQVYASRSAAPGSVGHIHINLAIAFSFDLINVIVRAIIELAFMMLPYLIWKFRSSRALTI